MPHLTHSGARFASEKVVNAWVEGIPLAFPGGTLPTRFGIHLKNLRLVPIYLTVDTGGQTAHAGSDNDYRLSHQVSSRILCFGDHHNVGRVPLPSRAICPSFMPKLSGTIAAVAANSCLLQH
jgi:hypothetical protein